MRIMPFRLATLTALIAAAGLSLTAQSSPQNPAPAAAPAQARSLQQQLQNARAALNAIDNRVVSGETARRLQTLRQDFAALETSFNEQMLNGPAGATAPGAMSAAGEKDWRVRYSSVESDVRDLIGTDPAEAVGGQPPATGAADLDPRMREQLQQFRTALQTFYAGTLGPSQPNAVSQPPAAPAAAVPTETAPQIPTPTGTPAAAPAADLHQSSDVTALLNRIETIVNDALKSTPATSSAKTATPVGTTGTITVAGAASNKVTIDRDKLDEIRAEVQQLKVILKK